MTIICVLYAGLILYILSTFVPGLRERRHYRVRKKIQGVIRQRGIELKITSTMGPGVQMVMESARRKAVFCYLRRGSQWEFRPSYLFHSPATEHFSISGTGRNDIENFDSILNHWVMTATHDL